MKMMNMECPKDKLSPMTPTEASGSMQSPQYPYGLRITLGNDELNKLGFKVDKHKVGESGTFAAKYVIDRLESREVEGGVENEVCLQVTDLGFDEKDTNLSFESKG